MSARFCDGHPPFMGSYPMLGGNCINCGTFQSDQHFKLCPGCSGSTNRCQYCGIVLDCGSSVEIPQQAFASHSQQSNNASNSFWKTHCPATMGGKCSYDKKGICSRCGRDKNKPLEDKVEEASEEPIYQHPISQGPVMQAPLQQGFVQQQVRQGPVIQRPVQRPIEVQQQLNHGPVVQQVQGGGDAFWETHCPATMGGVCHYVKGVCTHCKGKQK